MMGYPTDAEITGRDDGRRGHERGNSTKGLTELRDEAFRISKEHGFHEREKSMGEYCALIHSEVSEAFEDYRKGYEPRDYWYFDAGQRTSKPEHIDAINGKRCLNKPCGIPSEIADVIIRCLDFSGAHGIDIERAVAEKMAYNRTRPFKHGKKL